MFARKATEAVNITAVATQPTTHRYKGGVNSQTAASFVDIFMIIGINCRQVQRPDGIETREIRGQPDDNRPHTVVSLV